MSNNNIELHPNLIQEGSLLTTFNTPWGKLRWLRHLFSLGVSSNVFQERLDRLHSISPNINRIVAEAMVHGDSEVIHISDYLKQQDLNR